MINGNTIPVCSVLNVLPRKGAAVFFEACIYWLGELSCIIKVLVTNLLGQAHRGMQTSYSAEIAYLEWNFTCEKPRPQFFFVFVKCFTILLEYLCTPEAGIILSGIDDILTY